MRGIFATFASRSRSLFELSHRRPPWIYILSLHDALPISVDRLVQRLDRRRQRPHRPRPGLRRVGDDLPALDPVRSEEHTSELQSQSNLVCRLLLEKKNRARGARLWVARLDPESNALCAVSSQRSHHGAAVYLNCHIGDPPGSTFFPYTTLFRSRWIAWCSVSTAGDSDRIDHGQVSGELVMICRPSTRSDRKSTRLNSSHSQISYAVFCLKKKTVRAEHDCGSHVSIRNQTPYARYLRNVRITEPQFI